MPSLALKERPSLKGSHAADICVIGAGYTGLLTALNLSERGHDVTIVEANKLAWGASGRNGGQIGSGHNKKIHELEKDYGKSLANELWQLSEYGKSIVKTRIEKQEIERRVLEAAEILGISEYLDRKPRQLSGGQRQRVAIGRAIVREPEAFLFDEPLSNLDAALRVGMRLEIMELHKKLSTTMVYVTHDQVEAMTMADKIVVLQNGIIEQIGSPLDLYNTPKNKFVAGFIGSPKMNLIKGREAEKHNANTIGIRPEHVTVSKTDGLWEGRVGVAEHLGSDTFIHVHDTGLKDVMTVRITGDIHVQQDETIYLNPAMEQLHRFNAQGTRIK